MELHSQFATWAQAALDQDGRGPAAQTAPSASSTSGGQTGADATASATAAATATATTASPTKPEGVVDLGAILSGSSAAPQGASAGPSTITGSSSLWSVVFGGGQRHKLMARPELDPSRLQQLAQQGSGPVAEGVAAGLGLAQTLGSSSMLGCNRSCILAERLVAKTRGVCGVSGSGITAGTGRGKHGWAGRVFGRVLRRLGYAPGRAQCYAPGTASFLAVGAARVGARCGLSTQVPAGRPNSWVSQPVSQPAPMCEARDGYAESDGYSGDASSDGEGPRDDVSVPDEEAHAAYGHMGAGATSGNNTAPVLRSYDADRQAAILGAAEGEEEGGVGGGGVGGGAKRLCVRWLDELIIALWHDLQVRPGFVCRFRGVRVISGSAKHIV